MTRWKHYFMPNTLTEALNLLNHHQGQAQIIGGGTDLLLDMQQNHATPQVLVDITKIEQLRAIEIDEDTITIGAGVTHSQIVNHPILSTQATCLVEGCGVVGGPQVRNVATLGGNVAHALPAGDGTTALVALDAHIEVILNGQTQRLNILEMFIGPGQSRLNPRQDILTKIQIKRTKQHQGTAFKRIMRPQGVALPILNCAVWVTLDESGEYFKAVRLCLGPVAPTPIRPTQTEAVLITKPATEATIEQAITIAQTELKPRTSKYRASSNYRALMIAVLLRNTLNLAIQRARTQQAVPIFGK